MRQDMMRSLQTQGLTTGQQTGSRRAGKLTEGPCMYGTSPCAAGAMYCSGDRLLAMPRLRLYACACNGPDVALTHQHIAGARFLC